MTTNERIAFLMKKLDCTEEEAKDVIRCDRIIDAGGDSFPQSKEQAAASKKYRSVGTKKPTVYNLETRKKKQNTNKLELMEVLRRAVCGYDNFEIVNPERQVRFDYGGKTYEVTLTEKRVKKG